jgi:hypothetical protein
MSVNCNPLNDEEFDQEKFQAGIIKVLIAKDKGQHHFRVENESDHYLVKLRLIENNVKKCDYLVLDCSKQNVFFIELKGQNLGDAIKQIESTISVFASKIKQFKFYCRIVQTKVIGATQQNDKEKLVKYLNDKHRSNIEGKATDLVKIASQKLIEII